MQNYAYYTWSAVTREHSNGSGRRAHGCDVVVVDGEAELDHAVDAAAEGVGLVQGEAAG